MGKKTISDIQRLQIVAEYQTGVSAYRIAKNMNVSTQMVWYILNPEKLIENRLKAKERAQK